MTFHSASQLIQCSRLSLQKLNSTSITISIIALPILIPSKATKKNSKMRHTGISLGVGIFFGVVTQTGAVFHDDANNSPPADQALRGIRLTVPVAEVCKNMPRLITSGQFTDAHYKFLNSSESRWMVPHTQNWPVSAARTFTNSSGEEVDVKDAAVVKWGWVADACIQQHHPRWTRYLPKLRSYALLRHEKRWYLLKFRALRTYLKNYTVRTAVVCACAVGYGCATAHGLAPDHALMGGAATMIGLCCRDCCRRWSGPGCCSSGGYVRRFEVMAFPPNHPLPLLNGQRFVTIPENLNGLLPDLHYSEETLENGRRICQVEQAELARERDARESLVGLEAARERRWRRWWDCR